MGSGGTARSGIVAARRLVDTLSFRDDDGPPGVVLGLRLDRGTAAALSPARLAEVTRELASQRAADPRAEVEHLTRELARRDEMLRALRGELEDTNRGVMSLYAELDERAEYQRRAADLKSRVLSDMGHEMRTPIHSILSISQFLLQRLDGELTDEQDKQVRIIRNTARDLVAVHRRSAGPGEGAGGQGPGAHRAVRRRAAVQHPARHLPPARAGGDGAALLRRSARDAAAA